MATLLIKDIEMIESLTSEELITVRGGWLEFQLPSPIPLPPQDGNGSGPEVQLTGFRVPTAPADVAELSQGLIGASSARYPSTTW